MQNHFKDQKIKVSGKHKIGVLSDEYMNITEQNEFPWDWGEGWELPT